MKLRTTVLAFLLLVSATGCAATLRESGHQEVAWSSTDRPEWASLSKPYFRKDGKIYFVGASVSNKQQNTARLHAKAEAIRTMTDGVRLLTMSWLADSIHGSDDAQGSFLKAGVAAVSSQVDVSGFMPASEYAEKVRTWNGSGWEYSWDIYTLYELSEAEDIGARKRAMDGLRAQARKANDRKAELAAEQALKKLNMIADPTDEVQDGALSKNP
mgnify:CR=1 FL=1